MRNTLLLSFYNLVFTFPLPILLAFMINEIRFPRLKKVTQMITYVTAEQSTQERRNETKWSKPCKAVRSLGLNWRKRVILGTSSARAEP